MPHVLPRKQPLMAVSWDQQQLVYVVAQAAGSKISIQAARSISRSTDDEDPASVAELLQKELEHHHIKRAKILVGLARSQVEMLDLTLPPATDEELPELVRNQTFQQLPDVTDDSVIDFVMLDDDPSQPRKVAAAVAPAELLKHIQQQCAVAGQRPTCVTLRPLSAASLCCRIVVGPAMGKCLLVSRLDREADFSIIAQRRVIFSRTIRLAAEASEEAFAQQLVSEINRSLLVAPQTSDAEGPVEHVYMLGVFPEREETLQKLSDELQLPVSLLNPLEGVEFQSGTIPDDVQHLAGLLGMIRDHVDGHHAIDFVNPRRPPPPPNYRRKIAMYGAVAAVLVATVFHHFLDQRHQAEAEVQRLAGKVKDVELVLEATNKKKAIVDEIGRWQASDVNWLDELRDLSTRFPAGRDAVVQRLSALPSSSGGIIDLQVHVRDPSVMTRMENQLRDQYHQVRVKGVLQRSEEDAFRWQSDVTVYVIQRSKDQYAQHVGTPEDQDPSNTAEEPAPRILQAEPPAERK